MGQYSDGKNSCPASTQPNCQSIKALWPCTIPPYVSAIFQPMSHFDHVEVKFHGGPLEGSVSLPASDLGRNKSPIHSNITEICASWGDAYRNDRAFAGTVMRLPAVPLQQHPEWTMTRGQDAGNKYRVDWADLRDDRTLFLILTYLGTTVPETPESNI